MVRAEYWGNKAWDQQSLKAKIWRAWKRTGNKYFHFDNGEKISTWWPKVAFSNSASFNTYFIKCKCWAYDGPHSVQLLTCVWLFATSWTAAHQASLSITNSRNLSSWWCHPTISSSVVHFSSSHQSFPASGSFQMSEFFASGGQSIRVSASTSVLPMNT